MYSCTECGEDIEGSDRYCRACGADLEAPDAVTIDIGEDELQNRLQEVDEYEFEHFVAELWERLGWETEVSQAGTDAGIDVVATKESPYPEKQLIQAKRYSTETTVGGPEIQQYASLRHQDPDADAAVIVTTSSFTRHAEDRAEELNVKLVDGSDLVGIIEDVNGYDLLDKYVPAQSAQSAPAGGESTADHTRSESGSHATVDDVSPTAETVTAEQQAATTPPGRDPTPANSQDSTPIHSQDPTPADSQGERQNTDTEIPSGEPSSETAQNRSSPPSRERRATSVIPETQWKKGVQLCTLGWVALIVLIDSIPDAIGGFLVLGLWVGLPLTIYMDSKAIAAHSEWPNRRRLYLIGSVIWFVNIIVGALYLWQRRQAESDRHTDHSVQ